ncbi:gamma-glutamyl-gamma-aminobutyrate hydrolase family protein [Paraliomyxa miuraensis]|uniref:gamma-glutamyl-gamma-aminobutyrate hydrolase family protein n=1 Tax=Paraliomyxa miuraensis TaxID=376150 RepID=UPI00224D05A2|nr:gamma-glutamyl-gamma-aminobutyrate hydrolase family protein [Paraliomyxa miuraensis]MCX4241028.1 gamma-glutamyl-gamma-aminobutyrate hydrolase family protein [Paraliomyxa miuraensis]
MDTTSAPQRVRPCIGVSINFMHADPQRPVFKGMTLQYLEQRMVLSLHRAGAIPVGLPHLEDDDGARELVSRIDGLVLTGGADLSPASYGEEPLRPEWSGDPLRDAYEQRLIDHARAKGLPILGLCRGIQMINVALGGRLHQDIVTQRPNSLVHRDWHQYDALGHEIRIEPRSWVSRIYGDATSLEVNSVHHQGLSELAPPLRATAWAPDGVIEAVEMREGDEWIMGIQWHPEWLEPRTDDPRTGAGGRASGSAIFGAFVDECAARAKARMIAG